MLFRRPAYTKKTVKKTALSLLAALLACNLSFASIGNVGKARKMDFASDDQLLTYVQKQYFNFVWDGALENSGLSRERINFSDPEKDRYTIAVGSSGFGIAGIITGIERGFVSRRAGVERLAKIAGFLERSDRFHGMWPHWIDDRTGKVIPFANPASKDDGGDIVESAFMAQGLLAARQYLARGNRAERALSARFDNLWRGMEWDWYLNHEDNCIYWHWSPNFGWAKNFPIKGYNECLVVYILGASSPTHPTTKEAYYKGWARDGKILSDTTIFGINPIVVHNTGKGYVGPLFWTAFSYVGFDPAGLKDELGICYYDVNVAHVKIQYAYCLANPKGFAGYGASCWGLSAGYSVRGYKAHSTKTDLGVITPSGTLAAMPFAPAEVMAALRHFYFDLGDILWGPYGFYDGYVTPENRAITDYLGTNQCPTLPMIENYRTGLIWKLFMSSPEISKGLEKLGFTRQK